MSQAISGVIIGGGNIYSSPATKHEFLVNTTNKFTFKVVQSANQIITSTPVGRTVNNSDGTVSLALTDTTKISPNTNYIPGTVQRSYDDSTHTYTVTATDAEPIDGLVQDGWSVVYQKTPGEDRFYSKADYTGRYEGSSGLQGNILVGGMQYYSDEEPWTYPDGVGDNISKFKNTFITSSNTGFLSDCSSLTYVELPNLTKVTGTSFLNKALFAYVELPNLVNAGSFLLMDCKNLHSVELPKLTAVGGGLLAGVDMSGSSPMYFVDFGYITKYIPTEALKYTQVMVLRADTVPTNFTKSQLSDPVLYIVPSALVDTYKSKVRSVDCVTALEKSPFADGKTVCGNNMKTTVGHTDFSDIDEDARVDSSIKILCYLPSTQTTGHWEYNHAGASYDILKITVFGFCSKLTKERGYTIPTQGGVVAGEKSYYYPELENGVDFTVPDGVNVLHAVSKEFDSQADIACTPRSVIHFGTHYYSYTTFATIGNNGKTFLILAEAIKDPSNIGFTISWSPEINTYTPTVTDY